jgi:hypothetical protein
MASSQEPGTGGFRMSIGGDNQRMTKTKGSFELASWDEETYEETDGGKLTRASVKQNFSGGIDGEGAVEWLMAYGADGTARFVGLQRIKGTIGDRKGSFVLETTGDFDGEAAKWKAAVVPGSGCADFEGITGKAKFQAPRGPKASFELEYEFK